MQLNANIPLDAYGNPYEVEVIADDSGVQLNVQVEGTCKARVNLDAWPSGRVTLKAVEHASEDTIVDGVLYERPDQGEEQPCGD